MSVRAIRIKFVTALLFCLTLINAKNWDLIINTGRRKHFVKVCFGFNYKDLFSVHLKPTQYKSIIILRKNFI
jgi:hypothetical protein